MWKDYHNNDYLMSVALKRSLLTFKAGQYNAGEAYTANNLHHAGTKPRHPTEYKVHHDDQRHIRTVQPQGGRPCVN